MACELLNKMRRISKPVIHQNGNTYHFYERIANCPDLTTKREQFPPIEACGKKSNFLKLILNVILIFVQIGLQY